MSIVGSPLPRLAHKATRRARRLAVDVSDRRQVALIAVATARFREQLCGAYEGSVPYDVRCHPVMD